MDHGPSGGANYLPLVLLHYVTAANGSTTGLAIFDLIGLPTFKKSPFVAERTNELFFVNSSSPNGIREAQIRSLPRQPIDR